MLSPVRSIKGSPIEDETLLTENVSHVVENLVVCDQAVEVVVNDSAAFVECLSCLMISLLYSYKFN